MFTFGPPRAARRPSLTPMIDVVFLLLVFFMLAARFGPQTGIELSAGTASAAYSGPPRLVDLSETGLRLNGAPVARQDLANALSPLMQDRDDTIVVRPDPAVTTQQLVALLDTLKTAGYSNIAIHE